MLVGVAATYSTIQCFANASCNRFARPSCGPNAAGCPRGTPVLDYEMLRHHPSTQQARYAPRSHHPQGCVPWELCWRQRTRMTVD